MRNDFWHMMDGFGGYHMGGFGWIMMIVFWGVLIFGLVSLFQSLTGSRKNTESKDSALEMLRERYARGEIDEEEYQTRRKFLTESQ